MHGGSNYMKLEFPSNRKWIGKKAAVPSTFAIQPVTLSSWLLQHYGVAVGSLSEGGRHTVESRWLRVESLLGCCDEVLIAAENDGLRSFAGPDLAESHGFQFVACAFSLTR